MDLGLVAIIALGAGLAGGAMGAVVVGLIQAWMARARGAPVHRWEAISSSPRVPGTATPSVGTGPFDRFTDSGKRVLALAQDEAQRFNHSYIGPEHLLLGLSREADGVAARTLESLGATLLKLRGAAESVIGRGETAVGRIGFSETTKSVISKARYEARKLGHSYIGTEHLLLGLVRGGGIPMALLRALEIEPDRVRDELIATLGDPQPEQPTFDHLDTDSRKVMTLARQEAIQSGHSHIGTEHLAIALRLHRTPALDRIWGQLPVDPEALRRRIEVAVPPTLGGPMPTRLRTTPRMGTILTLARVLAAKRKQEQISPEIFLMALADEGGGVGAQVLASFGATAERIHKIVDGPTS